MVLMFDGQVMNSIKCHPMTNKEIRKNEFFFYIEYWIGVIILFFLRNFLCCFFGLGRRGTSSRFLCYTDSCSMKVEGGIGKDVLSVDNITAIDSNIGGLAVSFSLYRYLRLWQQDLQ